MPYTNVFVSSLHSVLIARYPHFFSSPGSSVRPNFSNQTRPYSSHNCPYNDACFTFFRPFLRSISGLEITRRNTTRPVRRLPSGRTAPNAHQTFSLVFFVFSLVSSSCTYLRTRNFLLHRIIQVNLCIAPELPSKKQKCVNGLDALETNRVVTSSIESLFLSSTIFRLLLFFSKWIYIVCHINRLAISRAFILYLKHDIKLPDDCRKRIQKCWWFKSLQRLLISHRQQTENR